MHREREGNANKIVVVKPEVKNPFRRLQRRHEDSNKILHKIVCDNMHWIKLIQ